MNKVKIKGIPFKLNGEIIKKDSNLSFKVIDKNNDDYIFNSQKGITIISVFPAINTKICDKQTQWIAKSASLNKKIRFISITKDDVKTINEWCLAKNLKNVEIFSDLYGDFSEKTKTLIKRINKLTRGFIVLEGNKIIDISFNKDVASEPDYNLLSKYIKE